MKYEDFKIETFNMGSVMRVTHIDSGIKKESNTVTKEEVSELIHQITDELQSLGKPTTFALALEQVITNGKGMHVESSKDFVVRAQFPDQYSISHLPYLYVESKYGRVPWSVDSFSPFALWVVVD